MEVVLFFIVAFGIAIAIILKENKDKRMADDRKNLIIRSNNDGNLTLEDFSPDVIKKIGDYSFLISEKRRELAIKYNGTETIKKPIIVSLDSLSGFEIIKDSSSVSSGAIGNAIVGNILAGGVGAIVASNATSRIEQANTIGIKFITNDLENPIIRVDGIYEKADKYKQRKFVERYSAKDILNQLEDFITVLNLVKG